MGDGSSSNPLGEVSISTQDLGFKRTDETSSKNNTSSQVSSRISKNVFGRFINGLGSLRKNSGSPPLTEQRNDQPAITNPLKIGLPEKPPVDLGVYETVVGEIEGSMLKIASEVKSHLMSTDYSCIVGDDTSARIPTLVLKGFADFISDIEGKEHITTIFIQAGRKVSDSTVEEQFQQRILPIMAKIPNKKALLVTEHVQTGKSITRLLKLFKKFGIPVDIASLQIQRTKEGQFPFEAENALVFEGEPDTNYVTRSGYLGSELKPPQIWGKPEISGIDYHYQFVPIARFNPDAQTTVNAARRDTQRMVNRIVSSLYYQTS